MKIIAVYGSSMVQPGEEDYDAGIAIGRALGQAGFVVMTGGYDGIMAAASQGAADVGGHVIGVTTDVFANRRGDGTHANQWVKEEIRLPTLRERLMHLVVEPDGYVCMPGGLGTMHELITVWELVRAGDIPRRPIVCYGDFWQQMLAALLTNPYIRKASWDYLHHAHSASEVVAFLKTEMDT